MRRSTRSVALYVCGWSPNSCSERCNWVEAKITGEGPISNILQWSEFQRFNRDTRNLPESMEDIDVAHDQARHFLIGDDPLDQRRFGLAELIVDITHRNLESNQSNFIRRRNPSRCDPLILYRRPSS